MSLYPTFLDPSWAQPVLLSELIPSYFNTLAIYQPETIGIIDSHAMTLNGDTIFTS